MDFNNLFKEEEAKDGTSGRGGKSSKNKKTRSQVKTGSQVLNGSKVETSSQVGTFSQVASGSQVRTSSQVSTTDGTGSQPLARILPYRMQLRPSSLRYQYHEEMENMREREFMQRSQEVHSSQVTESSYVRARKKSVPIMLKPTSGSDSTLALLTFWNCTNLFVTAHIFLELHSISWI